MQKRTLGALLVAAAIALPAFPAKSQSTLSVSIKTAKLTWKWEQGDGGPADGFNVLCGNSSGNYTKKTVLSATARSVPVFQVIDGYGTWYCAVESFNDMGVSDGRTNEVVFRTSDLPIKPFDAAIEAQ